MPFLGHDKCYGNPSCCRTNIHSHTNFPTSLVSESLFPAPRATSWPLFLIYPATFPKAPQSVRFFFRCFLSSISLELTACLSILSDSFLFAIQPVIKLSKRCISQSPRGSRYPGAVLGLEGQSEKAWMTQVFAGGCGSHRLFWQLGHHTLLPRKRK